MKRILKGVLPAMLLGAVCAQADTVRLECGQAGGALQLAIDSGSATVTWADGSKEQVSFDGTLRELTLKSAALTVEAPSITMLVCPGNDIKSIDLTGAPSLVELNAQDCGLESIKLGKGDALRYLNVANSPKLTEAILPSSCPVLETLVVSGCAFAALPEADRLPALAVLWAQDNKLKSLKLTAFENLEELYVDRNELTTVLVPASAVTVSATGNKLSKLDVRRATGLKTLDATGNAIANLSLNSPCGLEDFYVYDNALTFKYLPTVIDNGKNVIDHWAVAPQQPLDLGTDLDMAQYVAFSTPASRNADGVAVNPAMVWTDAEGNTLVDGVDYTFDTKTYRVTFAHAVKGATASITSALYPGFELETAPLNINDSGIEAAAADAVSVAVSGNTLTVTAAAAAEVAVTDLTGKLLRSGTLTGSWSRTLTPGIYFVNNTKVPVGIR